MHNYRYTQDNTLCPRYALPSPPSRRYAMRPIINMPEEDRSTDIGNMHKKFGKDRACGSGDILADRQTYSSQYFATAPTGEVIKSHSLTVVRECCKGDDESLQSVLNCEVFLKIIQNSTVKFITSP